MEHWEEFAKNLLERMGFGSYRVEVDPEHRHGSIFIYEGEQLIADHLPEFVESVNHLVGVVAQKRDDQPVLFDINNYRKERERLLNQLARAAARKAVATGEEVTLPPMNSYERRLIHVELAAHPEVITESQGIGKERRVIVRTVGDRAHSPTATL